MPSVAEAVGIMKMLSSKTMAILRPIEGINGNVFMWSFLLSERKIGTNASFRCLFYKLHSMYVLEREQSIPVELEKAWDFFSSPKNLQEITPDYLGFQIRSTLPQKMYGGLFIIYTVRPLLGIPMEWVTEITHVEELKSFIDEQRKGPYKIWHHEHHFEAFDGGVRMFDRVSYELPLGPLGKLAHPILVKGKLNEIFEYRVKKVEELFGKA